MFPILSLKCIISSLLLHIYIFICTCIYVYTQTYKHMNVCNLLGWFSVACVYMSLGLTTWDCITCQGSSPEKTHSPSLSEQLLIAQSSPFRGEFPQPCWRVGPSCYAGLTWSTLLFPFHTCSSPTMSTRPCLAAGILGIWHLSLCTSSSYTVSL